MSLKTILFTDENSSQKSETELGSAVTRASRFFDSGDVHAGFWECFEGSFTIESHAVNELCHILEGEAEIAHADGSVCSIKAGDSFFITKGTKMTWTVKKYLKKTYMVSP